MTVRSDAVLRLLSRLQRAADAEEFAAEIDGAPVIVELWAAGTGDAAARRAQARLAMTAQTLTGGGVARVLAVGVLRGRTAVVRSAFGAGTLLDFLATGPLPPPAALAVALSVARTLAQAHAARLLHGGLDERHVHLGKDGRVQLAGFGRRATPDEAADVRAAGALLFLSLLGRHPPDTVPTPEAVARQLPKLAPKAISVALRAVDPAPGRGFGTAAALAQAVEEALDAVGGAPPPEVWKRLCELRQATARTVLDDARVPAELQGPLELEAPEAFEAATERSLAIPVVPVPPDAAPEATAVADTVVEPPSVRAARARQAPPAPPPPVQAPEPAPTRRQYAMPFQRDGDVLPPDVTLWRTVAERRERLAARTGVVALVVMLTALVGFWYFTTADHVGALISYLPGPIERVLAERRGPQPRPPGPPPGPKVALESLRHGAATGRCYEPTTAERGTLLVVSAIPVEVEIDGLRLCGDVAKVSVDVGERQVWVHDPKGGAEQQTVVTIEPGKTAKLVAF